MRAVTLFLVFFIWVVSALAQEPGDEVQLFFKDQVSPVEAVYLDYNFFFNKLKVEINGENMRVHVKKLDSLIVDNDTLLVKNVNGRLYHRLQVLEKGKINLYSSEGEYIYIQKGNQAIYLVQDFGKFYVNFTMRHVPDEYPEMSKDEFIEKIREYNRSEEQETNIIHDSLTTLAPLFVFRVGAFMPSLGFEVGITKRLTLANGISVNMFGNVWRGAQTFVNYHTYHQLRYFMGYHKRLDKGKSNYKYSGVFIAPTAHYVIDIGRTPFTIYGLTLGLQEDIMINKAASIMSVGLGYDPLSRTGYLMTWLSLGLAF